MNNENKQKRPARTALGRGLSALISSAPVVQTDGSAAPALKLAPSMIPAGDESSTGSSNRRLHNLSLDSILANPSQPRQDFNESELKELAESIKAVGVIQPIVVRRSLLSGEASYEIIAGERRWRAAKLAGLTSIPAILEEKTEQGTFEIALIENIQRENLNPVEEALAYKRLTDEFSLTQKEIAERVGKDRASIANYIRLLTLPEPVTEMLKSGELSMGHAKAILTVREPSAQVSLARKAIKENLSVRSLEGLVSRVVVLDAGKRPKQNAPSSATSAALGINSYPDIVERLRRVLGTKVNLKHHKSGRGKIEIEYFSDQELERVLEVICHS